MTFPIHQAFPALPAGPAVGGKDPLPKALPGLPAAPGVSLWVAEAEGGGAAEGVLGAHRRGEIAVLFGARVREQARGRGLGAALLVGGSRQAGRGVPPCMCQRRVGPRWPLLCAARTLCDLLDLAAGP